MTKLNTLPVEVLSEVAKRLPRKNANAFSMASKKAEKSLNYAGRRKKGPDGRVLALLDMLSTIVTFAKDSGWTSEEMHWTLSLDIHDLLGLTGPKGIDYAYLYAASQLEPDEEEDWIVYQTECLDEGEEECHDDRVIVSDLPSIRDMLIKDSRFHGTNPYKSVYPHVFNHPEGFLITLHRFVGNMTHRGRILQEKNARGLFEIQPEGVEWKGKSIKVANVNSAIFKTLKAIATGDTLPTRAVRDALGQLKVILDMAKVVRTKIKTIRTKLNRAGASSRLLNNVARLESTFDSMLDTWYSNGSLESLKKVMALGAVILNPQDDVEEYYQKLRLPVTATPEEIKWQYKAMQTQKLTNRSVDQAAKTLMNPNTRVIYDLSYFTDLQMILKFAEVIEGFIEMMRCNPKP